MTESPASRASSPRLPRPQTLLLLGSLLAVTPVLPAQGPPPEPYVQRDVCPFECCTYRTWTATDTIAMLRAEGGSDTLLLLPPGALFQAVTGNVHLRQVGIVLLRTPFTVPEEDSLPALSLAAGDTAWVLSYLGEGWYSVWIEGTIRALPAFWDDRREYPRPMDRPGRLVREPDPVWWVRVTMGPGREGWIRMDRASVSGSDACG